MSKISVCRKGCKDVWNAFMVRGAHYTSNDIPLCPTTADKPPTSVITWTEAKSIYKKALVRKDYEFCHPAYVCFYEDDQKFDGPRGIWHDYNHALKILHHFGGVITPDFSTYQDFPEPIKLYATYRMRAFGFWLTTQGIKVINNVRWGTQESYWYCFDGIPTDSIVAIGTVGGGPRKLKDRERFENGLIEMVNRLRPHTIIVYGSAGYLCFEKLLHLEISVISYPSKKASAFDERRRS